jgi:hypothetical protein
MSSYREPDPPKPKPKRIEMSENFKEVLQWITAIAGIVAACWILATQINSCVRSKSDAELEMMQACNESCAPSTPIINDPTSIELRCLCR